MGTILSEIDHKTRKFKNEIEIVNRFIKKKGLKSKLKSKIRNYIYYV